MRMVDSQWRRKGAATNSDAGLKPGGYKVKSTGLKTGHYLPHRAAAMLRLYKVVRAAWAQAKSLCYQNLSGGAGHAPGAAFGDVAVGFVPAHGAFERSGDRAGLETQFALRARTIHEHHVARRFY